MKCELCQSDDACVQVKQLMGGQVRELWLCEGCAEAHGMKPPAGLAGALLESLDALAPSSDAVSSRSCPSCHLRAADFRKTTRLGCGTCYEAFEDLLLPMLDEMHRATEHRGRRPVREDVRAEIAALADRLGRAVAAEAYEEAAGLRDRIRLLELANRGINGEGVAS